MILALLVLGVALLAYPGLHGVPSRRLPLNEWVPVATVALVAGLVAVEVSLLFIALPTVSHSLGLTSFIDTCHDALAPIPRDPTVVAWLAAAFGGAIGLRFTTGVLHAGRAARAARAEPWLGEHFDYGDFDLIVLPTRQTLAFGVPGAAPQVLISEGLVNRLAPEPLDALIRHEAAHHRLGHARYLRFLTGLERAFGGPTLMDRSTHAVRDGLEAWADDEASAGSDETGAALRRALVDVAANVDGTIADRAQRLTQPTRLRPTAVRVIAYAPIGLLAVTGVLLVVGWMTDAQHAFALGTQCAG